MRARISLALLAVLAWPSLAEATTVRALSIAEHAQLSDAVVVGRVLAQVVAYADGQSFVDSTIEIERRLRGSPPARIVVRQLGPTRVVVGDGRLAIGDRVVVFVRRGPHDRFYLTALAQSVYRIVGSGGAAPLARELEGLSLVQLDAQGRLVRAPVAPTPTLDVLERAIREVR